MSAVKSHEGAEYYIYEYPVGPSNDQYQFVVKQANTCVFITASAGELVYHYPHIVEGLPIKESNNVHFYLGLEVANDNKKLKTAIKAQRNHAS
mgnify:CR=1 FL=1